MVEAGRYGKDIPKHSRQAKDKAFQSNLDDFSLSLPALFQNSKVLYCEGFLQVNLQNGFFL